MKHFLPIFPVYYYLDVTKTKKKMVGKQGSVSFNFQMQTVEFFLFGWVFVKFFPLLQNSEILTTQTQIPQQK